MTDKTIEFMQFVSMYQEAFGGPPSIMEYKHLLGREPRNVPYTLGILAGMGLITWQPPDLMSVKITPRGMVFVDVKPFRSNCDWKELQSIWRGERPEALHLGDIIRMKFMRSPSREKYGIPEDAI